MEKLHQEISQKLIETLEMYMDGKATLEDVKTADMEEKLVYTYMTWSTMKESLKASIFAHTKALYYEMNALDKDIRMVESLCENRVYEIDIDAVGAHSQMVGRNRMPPPGYGASNWYVGPFPTPQMLQALRPTEDTANGEEVKTKEERVLRKDIDSSFEEE